MFTSAFELNSETVSQVLLAIMINILDALSIDLACCAHEQKVHGLHALAICIQW